MNAPLMTTATAAPAAAQAQARTRSDARCAPPGQAQGGAASARCGPGDDGGLSDGLAAPGDAGLLAPPPGLLGAWQAALLAREHAPSALTATGAAATGERSSTQQAVSAVAQAQGPELGQRGAMAGALPTDAPPLRIEAEFRPGAGPAWQMGLQRGPDAATWSLHLATSAVPAAWGATQLPRLERRLRLQGHAVDAHWGARSGPPDLPGEHDER